MVPLERECAVLSQCARCWGTSFVRRSHRCWKLLGAGSTLRVEVRLWKHDEQGRLHGNRLEGNLQLHRSVHLVLNLFAALKRRRLQPRRFAFATCWVLFVLLPAALVGSGDGVHLAQAAVDTASIPFLRHAAILARAVH